MSTEKKKKPSEYPLFAFRIDEGKKEELNLLIEDVRESLNKKVDPEDKLWMKNDVIYEALKLGLSELVKRTKKNLR